METNTHEANTQVIVTWREGDTILVNGKQGKVGYVYTNGYTLVRFPDVAIKGGLFNNNSTFGNTHIRHKGLTAPKEENMMAVNRQPHCPNCKSGRVDIQPKYVTESPYYMKRHKCRSCGHQW